MTYSVDYFISKFDAIPDENWTTDFFEDPCKVDKKCALGHCGIGWHNLYESTKESNALDKIFELVGYINDGRTVYSELGDTPKERILNALLLVKLNMWKEAVG